MKKSVILNNAEISIILPTYNESKNIRGILDHIKKSFPSNLKLETIIVDDNSSTENLNIIKKIIDGNNIEIINLDYTKYKNKISKQKNKETFANLASLLQSFEMC